MALSQPTNIIPSSFTDGVVDAVGDIASISWQVNGNSAMTAYKIDFFKNDTVSTEVADATTGKISDGIPAGGFFGTDRFGQPKMFTWTAYNDKNQPQTWNAFNSAFINGDQFKFKITQYWREGGVEKSREQIESSVFITRDKPSLDIQRSDNENFTGATPFKSGSILPASIGYFVGAYSQAQGAPVREVRWQVATWVNGKTGEILADTGDVDTPTLQFEFNGFFIGNEYAVRCSGKADYQTYGTQDFDSKWVNFTAKIPDDQKQSEYSGNFTVQCLPKENAALLEWEAIEVIPPSFSPDGFNPTTSNGSAILPAEKGETEYSVTWKEKVVVENGKPKSTPLNFTAPWTAVWAGQINSITYSYLNDIIYAERPFAEQTVISVAAFSPDGKTLVLGGAFSGYAAVFSVNGTTITYVGDITKNRAELGYIVEVAAFSPNGKTLVLGGEFSDYTAVFSVNGTTITYQTKTPWDEANGFVYSAAFSPDGKTLVLGGGKYNNPSVQYIGKAFLFTVDGTKLELATEITLPSELGFGGEVYSVAFSPNGKTLVLGGRFPKCYVYSVSGTEINYLTTIQKNGNEIGNTVDVISFSPDGRKLILGGVFSGECSAFSVNGTKITYVENITKNGAPLSSSIVYVAKFSPDGENLIVGGTFNGAASIYRIKDIYPNGKLLNITFADKPDLTISKSDLEISLNSGTALSGSRDIPVETKKLVIIITQSFLYLYSYNEQGLSSKQQLQINYGSSPITSVSIYGGDTGSTVDSVSVYQGNESKILTQYENPNFEPVWNSKDYSLYMTANFNGNLEGGTGTASGNGFRIYRQEVGSNILTPIANLKSTVTSLKDYGIRSRKTYTYSLYAYDNNQAFMQTVKNNKVIGTCFTNYSLLVCDYDSVNDAYHVRKQYLFALNLSASSESNNNSPTFNKNFTPYPTRMADTANYTSGTLQGLIGVVYTVPALIKEINGHVQTVKPSTIDYFDSVDLEKELKDLSVTPYTLFMRDMKGHLRMVATNNQVGMTPDLKKRQIPLTMSFPWSEIGDASDVTIIQTPDDYEGSDDQTLDIRLNADPMSSVFSASYPKPYEGTKFYLTVANDKARRG